MEEHQNLAKESQNKAKQQITVPFVWEERPGEPKKDWKPTLSEPSQPLQVQLPVTYIASIPFKWEEKPGTPLPCFANKPKELITIQETVPENGCLPFPPAYLTKYWDESDEEESLYGDHESDELNCLSDFEALSINSEESCSSVTLSASVAALQNPFLMEESNEKSEFMSSPGSSSGICRSASLQGALFLQQLFPLYPPKSGFLNKASSTSSNGSSVNCHMENEGHWKNGRGTLRLGEGKKKFADECRRRGVIRRPLTLAELILMSRKRSYRRKAVHVKKPNHSREFTKKNAQGCFNFGNNGRIAKLFGKDLLTINLG